jgi:small-conductance mechanosensitive channel
VLKALSRDSNYKDGKHLRFMFMIYHRLIFPLFFYLLLCFFIPPQALAQQNSADVTTEKSSIEEFKQSLEKAINNEKEKLDELKRQFSMLEENQTKVKEELNGYTIQISAHNNLFLLPDTSIKDLEEARLVNQAEMASVSDKIKKFEQRAGTVDLQLLKANEQSLVNESQLKEFKEQKPLTESMQSVIKDLQELNKLFSSKKATLDKIQQTHRNNIQDFKLTRKALSDLAEKFENQIQVRKKEELFKRTSDALFGVGIKPLVEEFFQIEQQIRTLFSKSFWETELSVFWRSSDFYTFSSLLLFLLLIILFFRMGRHLDRFLKDSKMEPFPWTSLTLRILRRSLLLLGFVLFFYLYSAILAINSGISLFHLSLTLLFIWLFTKWPIDLLKLWNNDNRPNLPFAVHFRIRLLIVFIRYFAMAYMSIQWLISSSSIILVLGRFVFEISLLIWTACFWRLLRKKASDFFSIQYKGIRVFHTFTSFILYTVAGVGFLLDLTGFGTLAVYWYTSCAKSAIVFMWSGLIFLSIKEWANKAPARQKTEDYSEKRPAFPIRWLTLRIAGLFLALLFLFSILLAWGANQALLLNIYNVLNYPFHVGQMRFSLLNMIYAFLAVVLTHVIVRFWRHILRDKILDNKDLEPGLKDSVTTITVYIAWALGILIALRAFGLSTTSMAVAFGALGIGLGFGLQNIFSNFISGIILLFERPIQVGDAIEINGTWGEVRKINVRSTLVQTYDNASLIIPNAEFISSQVTNWSFKDMRLRRTIVVGVAYGSDVNLVKKTLEEIAQKITWVLKFPVPQVLFSDFGDSALIFRVRVWTDIDHMLTVESDIRFEIYRLFNERGIEIAFPQLDLHVRSVVDKETFLDNRTDGRSAIK